MRKFYFNLALVFPGIVFSTFSFSQTIVNGYAEVIGVGSNTVSVSNVDESYDTFEDGEQVIIIQMQDNVIGTKSNTANFGNIGNIKSAGLYEIKTIASHTENGLGKPVNLTFTDPISVSFNAGPHSSIQLVSFPQLGSPNYTTSSDLTAKSWDGVTGGIIAFEVIGTFTLANDINVDGKGFRGAIEDINSSCGGSVCESTVYISHWNTRALKGEGIYKNTNPNYEAARGRILNGGGGGSCHNAAGGGGGNFTAGGIGGMGWGCQSSTYEAGGFGGLALGSYISSSRVFMGGGGGAGEANNGHNTAGGNGGGLIILKIGNLATNGANGLVSMSADGSSAADIGNDGAGGAGAGGTIIIEVSNWSVDPSGPIEITANGGHGGSSLSSGVHGGGGGGGQGAIIFSKMIPPIGVNSSTLFGDGGCGNTSSPCNSLAGSGSGPNNLGIISFPSGPLPIELIYFSAEAIKNEAHFSWQTASESHSDYFFVERMDIHGDWYTVAKVKAAGNSNTPRNYKAIDYHPTVGDNYYRLKEVDYDGELTIYDPQIAYFGEGEFGDFVIYPNPSTGVVNFDFAEKIDLKELALFDLSGKLIRNLMISDQQLIEIDLSDLPKGVYMIKVNDEIQKLVLTH